jgi:hypothetical protein
MFESELGRLAGAVEALGIPECEAKGHELHPTEKSEVALVFHDFVERMPCQGGHPFADG